MDVRLPDGRILKNVPEGTTREQIEAKLGAKLSKPEPADDGFSAVDMAKNIPGSAWQFAKDITRPITHPISTAESLFQLGTGAAQKVMPEFLKEDFDRSFGAPTDNTETVDAVGQLLKQRFGGVDETLGTLERDPVGAVSDLSGALTGGGSLVPKLGGLARVGKAIDPVNAVTKGASQLVPQALPRSMFESAAKFSTTIDTPRRKKMVDTAVTQGIMPTQAGVDKLNKIVGENSRKIDDLILQAEQAGKRVPRDRLFRNIDDLKKELTGPENLFGTGNAKKIDKVLADYAKQLDDAGITDLTPSQVQQLKKNIYQDITFNVSRGKGNFAKEATGKAIARGAREAVEEIDPSIAPLNRETGDLLDIRDHVTRSANRIENRDFIGLDPASKILPAAVVGGAPGAAIGTAASIGGLPRVKARSALLLEALRKYQTQNASVPHMMTRQGAVQSGRLDDAKQDLARSLGR